MQIASHEDYQQVVNLGKSRPRVAGNGSKALYCINCGLEGCHPMNHKGYDRDEVLRARGYRNY